MVNRYEKDSVREVMEAISSFRMAYSVVDVPKGKKLKQYAKHNEKLVLLLFRFLETMRKHNNDEEREEAVEAIEDWVAKTLKECP